MQDLSGDDKIVVCAECFSASCWLGEICCCEAEKANTTTIAVSKLKQKISRKEIPHEHETWWMKTKLTSTNEKKSPEVDHVPATVKKGLWFQSATGFYNQDIKRITTVKRVIINGKIYNPI